MYAEDDKDHLYKPGLSRPQFTNHTKLRAAERHFRKSFEGIIETSSLTTSPKIVGYFRQDKPIYEVDGCGGFLVCPEALSFEEQICLSEKAFTCYLQPPNQTSLDVLYGFEKLGIGEKAFSKKDPQQNIFIQDEAFVRRVRWANLGYQYDWTSKLYQQPNQEFPSELTVLAKKFAEAIGHLDFKPEAGFVNLYQAVLRNDSLTSHIDKSELNMAAPLISLSLGVDGVFVLGGKDRDDPVKAFRLRSGDITVLIGESRQYYHGIPRVLPTYDIKVEGLFDRVPLLRGTRLNINIRQVTL